ncbi:hypothetical protein V8G54_009995 [Vigna mungo]|uniref:PB1-like domain-containing protein n=1 Tax=Vigna mungo TaxID=3915 RepID=A0AAQ3S5D7_VIGMU
MMSSSECSGQSVSNNARYLCSGVQLEESEIFGGHSLGCRTEVRAVTGERARSVTAQSKCENVSQAEVKSLNWSKGCYHVNREVFERGSQAFGVDFRGRLGDIEVVIHHRGKLVNEGCLKYEGECDTIHFDHDLWSYFVVVSVAKVLGYAEFKDLYDKLKVLSDDVGAMHMVNLARLNGRVHLYVVHSVSQPDMIEYNVDEEVEEVLPEMHNGEHDGGVTAQFSDGTEQLDEGVGVDVGEGDRIKVDVVEGEGIEVDVGEGEGIQHDEAHDEDTIEVHVQGEGKQHDEAHDEDIIEVHVQGKGKQHDDKHDEETIEVDVEGEGIQHVEGHVEETIEVHVEGEGIQHVEGHVEGHAQERNDEANRIEGNDVEANRTKVNEWTSSDDDIGEVNIIDGEVNSLDGLVNINIQCDFRERDSCGNMEVDCSVLFELDLEEHDISDSSLFNDEWEFEELTSPDISDEETDVEKGYGNFVTFTMPKKMLDFKWEVGTYFGQKVDILDAIKTYTLENGKKLKFIKNDKKKRIRIKCMGAKGECPWMTYFGYMEAIDTWQLRTVVDRHTCSREHKLGPFNAKWLSKKLEKTVRENPTVKGIDIREKISRKWNITISKNMAYRAKAYASDEVEGSFTMQYSRIYDYAHELLARNPGSTIKVKLQENDQMRIFERFYACHKACKDSFLSCRPIIGLDGAFLKGRYAGELLTAVARDANDQMMPLAYVVVELLIEDLGGPDFCSSLTLISDQQKGLLQAVEHLLPRIAHRFCVRDVESVGKWGATHGEDFNIVSLPLHRDKLFCNHHQT